MPKSADDVALFHITQMTQLSFNETLLLSEKIFHHCFDPNKKSVFSQVEDIFQAPHLGGSQVTFSFELF